MDSTDTDTTTSEEMKRSVTKVQAMEEENKNLKLKIIELTQELKKMEERENNCVCLKRQDEQVILRKTARRDVSETDLKTRTEETPVTVLTLQIEGTHEKSRMNGSHGPVMSMSSESADSQLDEVQVKEEHVDEFIQDNLHTEMPSMEEDGEIDIKEEDVGYGQSNSKQDCDDSAHNPIPVVPLHTDQSSDIPIKHEIDRSIQRMFRSADKVSNIKSVSGHFGPEVGTDSEHNRSSSFHLTKELICPKLVKPTPQVTRTGLRGQKKKRPYLTTRPAEKFQCKHCSSAFDTRYKLMEHNKGGKCKAPFNCPHCVKSFGTIRVFTIHIKTHTGEKKKQSTSVRIDKELRPNLKRSLTLEDKKVNTVGVGLPEKKRKEVCNEVEMAGVRDGINPPFLNEIENNPLDIKEILERILSNLGKHDLLNARLVSRAWNDRSLEILRKSKFTQMLKGIKIKEYIDFMTSSEPHPFIIPFHLDFSISSSVSFDVYNSILTSLVESLCHTFGPQCVSTLRLTNCDTEWTEESSKDICLIELLVLISPGLKTLDLTGLRFRNDLLKNQKIIFTKLKKLVCDTRYCESGRSGPDLTYISIIENSPNLEDLTLTHHCDLGSWPLKFCQLKSLSLHEMFKPQNILDKIISGSGPPVLRELRLGFINHESWSCEDNTVLYNILKSVSVTLKSLTFLGPFYALNVGVLKFPKLPYLEHLGLKYDNGNHCTLYTKHMNFNQQNFPSLKFIELPIGLIITPPPVQSQGDDDVKIEFPNLTKIIMRVNAMIPEDVHGPLEHLQNVFPTPSKLCLVNVGGHGFVKYVLYRIMKSNWSKNIQQIEMIGFSQDHLGGILNRLEFNPLVDLKEWWYAYATSINLLNIEFQNTMKRMRMEFEEIVAETPGIIILKRAIQSG